MIIDKNAPRMFIDAMLTKKEKDLSPDGLAIKVDSLGQKSSKTHDFFTSFLLSAIRRIVGTIQMDTG